MKRNDRGDNLIIFCLMILAILLLLWGMKRTAYAEIGEVTFEPIPQDQEENTVTEMPGHTHDVKCVELTYEEAQLLMQIAQAEAGNQGEDGMFFVMSVVMNRVQSEEWPNDIKSVIYEPFQFYTKGMYKTELSPECHQALARIEKGEIAPQIIGFEKTTSKTLDKYFSGAFEYRDHKFYTLSK